MDSGQPDPGTNPAGNPLLEMAGHGAAAIPTSAPIASSPVYISSPRFKVQGFFICHMINYTGYNQK